MIYAPERIRAEENRLEKEGKEVKKEKRKEPV